MNPWLETIGISLVALLGIAVGGMFSRLKTRAWVGGYFLALLLIVTLLIARLNLSLAFVPPLSWLVAGRARYVVLCLAVTIGLTSPLSRLRGKFQKVMIYFIIAVVVVYSTILPFLVPALIRKDLSKLKTRFDINGICYQTTDYTCGPAAAVTALNKLGLPAEEGEIAILAHSSPVTGTLPKCLYKALDKRYSSDGLKSQYRYFDSLAELKNAGITLAVVRDSLLREHCVAVLEVSEEMVTFADPAGGKISMSHGQFEKIWRFTGITLKRDAT